jgi:predicted dienelactone hydrolase
MLPFTQTTGFMGSWVKPHATPAFGGLVAITLVYVLCPGATQANTYGAGFLDLTLTDPVEGGSMQAIVFYPTRAQGTSTRRGPFTIDAALNAPLAAGPFPLIVFSHGTGGSLFGHHDSLAALARAGFVAAAVEHPRDNYRDDSGFATDLQLIGRPHHMVGLINGVLTHARVGPLIDQARIGMVGHSAGGYTALLIAGAVPNFELQAEYRRVVPFDPLRQRADAAGRERRKPDLTYIADPRVRAIFLMAPALGYVFDDAGLSKVQVPVRLYRPSADELLAHPWNAERIAQMLPRPPEYQVIDGGGHFVFLAPCTAEFAVRAPAICTDPAGIDRTAFHKRLNDEMLDFFARTLPK